MKNILKTKIYKLITHLFFCLFSLSFLLPFIMILSVSLSNEGDIDKLGYRLIPKVIDLSAYKYVLASPKQIISSYEITIFSSFVGTFLSILIMSMIAYALSRKNNIYKNAISFIIFFTMLFSGGLIPTYILITKYLGMGNTVWVYIFPGLVNAWYIIMLRTFFQGIPESLIESAKIDGANESRICFGIIMPLSKPAIATVAILTLLVKWNDWYTSLIYIRSKELYTLQFLLQRILREAEFISNLAKENVNGFSVDQFAKIPTQSMRFALCIIAAGPMLVIFPFFQKYFTKGLTVGAVKG